MDYQIIQITGDEAVVARFRKQRGKLFLVNAARHPAVDGDLLASTQKEAAPVRGEAARIVLSLPPLSLFLRDVELPISDRKKVRDLLPLELAGEIALDGEEMVFDAVQLGDGRTLAIWGKRRELAEKIAQLAGTGMEPEIITASVFHWQSLLPEGLEETVALTDGEALAVYRGGQPVYFRSLGGDGVAEVRRTLTILAMGKGIDVGRVFLFGNAVHWQGSEQAADGEPPFLPLPVSEGLNSSFCSDEDARDLAAAYAAASACAFGDPVNLRSGPLAYTAGRAKTMKKLRFSLILGGVLVFLVFAEVGVRFFLVKRDLDSLNASIQSIYRTVFPTRKKATDEVAELRSEIKKLGGSAATGGIILPTLKKLAEAKGEDISGMYEVEIDKEEVRLKGDARSIQAVNDFKTRVASLFSGAEVGEIKSRPDGSVSFVFRGTIKESEK